MTEGLREEIRRALHPDPHWCCTPDGGNYVFGSGHGSQPMPCLTVVALDGEDGG